MCSETSVERARKTQINAEKFCEAGRMMMLMMTEERERGSESGVDALKIDVTSDFGFCLNVKFYLPLTMRFLT